MSEVNKKKKRKFVILLIFFDEEKYLKLKILKMYKQKIWELVYDQIFIFIQFVSHIIFSFKSGVSNCK